MRKLIVSERVLSAKRARFFATGGKSEARNPEPRSPRRGPLGLGAARKEKILINFLVGAFFVALPALAIDYNLLAPIKDLQAVSGENIFGQYMSKFIPFVLAFAAVAAVVQIVIGGFEYALSEAITNKQEAKDRISSALSGLLLALASFLILNAINPNLTSLQLTVPPIGTLPAQTRGNDPGCGLYDPSYLPPIAGQEYVLSPNSCVGAGASGPGPLCYCIKPIANAKKCCYTTRSRGGNSCYDAAGIIELGNVTDSCPAPAPIPGFTVAPLETRAVGGETCQQTIEKLTTAAAIDACP